MKIRKTPKAVLSRSQVWLIGTFVVLAASIFGCSEFGFDASCHKSNLKHSSSYPKTLSGDEPIHPLEYPIGNGDDKVLLGKLLFHDQRLSRDNSIACATCHDIGNGGDDGLPVSIGIDNQQGLLNAPTVFNSGLSIAQFWDGRAKDLKDQLSQPIHSPVEMGSSWSEIVAKLRRDEQLNRRFYSTFGRGISRETITEAIVCYENALITLDAPFDRYLRNEASAISNDAVNGYRLFKSIGCIYCHQGQTVGGNMFQEFGVLEEFGDQFDGSLEHNQGRFNVTKREADMRRFKVPSLRNIEQTSPYFHDGSIESLDDAIRIMAEYQLGEALDEQQVKLIREFLHSLTGSIRKELL